MRESLLLLRDAKSFKKLCRKIDHDFNCKGTNCDNCPITIFARVEWLVNNKGMSLGEGYNCSVRKPSE